MENTNCESCRVNGKLCHYGKTCPHTLDAEAYAWEIMIVIMAVVCLFVIALGDI